MQSGLGKSLHPAERPPLFRLLKPCESVLVDMLQYYSSLLCSASGTGRLRFLWMPLRYQTYEQFCRCEADRVREARRVLMLACAWQFRRHWAYLSSDTFSLAMVGDAGACPDSLRDFLAKWRQQSSCCVAPGLPRALKLRQLSADDLQSPAWRHVLYWYGASLQLSIADVEAKHAVNRQNTDCGFSTVAAKFINAEACLCKRQAQEAVRVAAAATAPQRPGQQPSAAVAVQTRSRHVKKIKAKSGLELFRADWLKNVRSSAGDVRVNPCTRDAWAAVRRAWAQLTPAQKSAYEGMASSS